MLQARKHTNSQVIHEVLREFSFVGGGWVVKHHPSKGRLNALKMIFKFHLL